MKLSIYLKERIFLIISYLFLITFINLFLLAYKSNNQMIIIINILFIIFGLILLLYEYFKKRNFYNKLLAYFKAIDRKYLISTMINEPNFFEGKILFDILYEANKDMNENINSYKFSLEDFKDYIELWVHEIKAPITSSLLIIHNNKSDTEILLNNLKKIEYYVEQVLYYSKIDKVEEDYNIKKVNLQSLINKVIKENKYLLLSKKIKMNLNNLEIDVYSDSKWLEFIINQIINNSIKYINNNGQITISAKKSKNDIRLVIEDNGIGIAENDIRKVFNKGFTGKNGRLISSSTGIGLYIVKKLCDKLKHDIKIESIQNSFTRVTIIFPINNFYDVLNK